ncbi:GNAT family N-acetyltransferase [Flavihumibacter sp. R14]|nr:GNAT family N-acetyltransferase [Flavihumibacter soli]
MIKLLRTDSDNPDFRTLVALLDTYLSKMDGEEHSFYAQYNKLDKIHHVVVAYDNRKAAGCGAIKTFTSNTAEVKRMYVHPDNRQKGIASLILAELEQWARELKFDNCILETGKRQAEAINLYQKMDYQVIENYGQYSGVENSVCMKKSLSL